MSKDERDTFLKYGELASKKARNEANAEEIVEMQKIQERLQLSHEKIIDKLEHILKQGY